MQKGSGGWTTFLLRRPQRGGNPDNPAPHSAENPVAIPGGPVRSRCIEAGIRPAVACRAKCERAPRRRLGCSRKLEMVWRRRDRLWNQMARKGLAWAYICRQRVRELEAKCPYHAQKSSHLPRIAGRIKGFCESTFCVTFGLQRRNCSSCARRAQCRRPGRQH